MNILSKAIEVYGKENQLTVAVEEFSELIKEICKHKRGEDNKARIIEEMADCYIMLRQLEMMFGITAADLNKEIGFKNLRLKKRIEKEERK